MWYLFLQIWVWLIVAFALGWFSHWFLCCRGNKAGRDIPTSAAQPEPDAHTGEQPVANNDGPEETDNTNRD